MKNIVSIFLKIKTFLQNNINYQCDSGQGNQLPNSGREIKNFLQKIGFFGKKVFFWEH